MKQDFPKKKKENCLTPGSRDIRLVIIRYHAHDIGTTPLLQRNNTQSCGKK